MHAPDIEGGTAWLNVKGPLSMSELRGKVVLLHFWTASDIESQQVFPQLRELERRFPRELVIIGVHSPKFPAERSTELVRHAVLRHGLEHPVVNDADHLIWLRYEVTAWPTIVIVEPTGRVAATAPGEPTLQALEEAISQLVAVHRDQLDRAPLAALAAEQVESGPLRFPRKLLATEQRLYIADTGHHRVLVTDHAGQLIREIGSGEPGLEDGPVASARLRSPAGMSLHGDQLYVADTENHCVRRVDLAAGTIKTVAGTGEQGHQLRAGRAESTALSSPWDVENDGERLLIASAGMHALWQLDLSTRELSPIGGTGRPHLADGSPREAGFSQPRGLAVVEGELYVADSDASSVRVVDLTHGGRVSTVVGGGVPGDVDGVGAEVRLQRVVDVHAYERKLLLADAYNHKIKLLDPETRICKTLLGDGTPGMIDGGSPRFNEPSGLATAAGLLFVADKNNHAVRVVELGSRVVRTLELR